MASTESSSSNISNSSNGSSNDSSRRSSCTKARKQSSGNDRRGNSKIRRGHRRTCTEPIASRGPTHERFRRKKKLLNQLNRDRLSNRTTRPRLRHGQAIHGERMDNRECMRRTAQIMTNVEVIMRASSSKSCQALQNFTSAPQKGNPFLRVCGILIRTLQM